MQRTHFWGLSIWHFYIFTPKHSTFQKSSKTTKSISLAQSEFISSFARCSCSSLQVPSVPPGSPLSVAPAPPDAVAGAVAEAVEPVTVVTGVHWMSTSGSLPRCLELPAFSMLVSQDFTSEKDGLRQQLRLWYSWGFGGWTSKNLTTLIYLVDFGIWSHRDLTSSGAQNHWTSSPSMDAWDCRAVTQHNRGGTKWWEKDGKKRNQVSNVMHVMQISVQLSISSKLVAWMTSYVLPDGAAASRWTWCWSHWLHGLYKFFDVVIGQSDFQSGLHCIWQMIKTSPFWTQMPPIMNCQAVSALHEEVRTAFWIPAMWNANQSEDFHITFFQVDERIATCKSSRRVSFSRRWLVEALKMASLGCFLTAHRSGLVVVVCQSFWTHDLLPSENLCFEP